MKKVIKKIKELLNKHEELVKYLIIGFLTTALNYIVFAILVKIANVEMHTSNIIAWLVSIIFAYFTNKLFVFESKSFELKVIGKEVLSFGAARILSFLLEELILYIFVNVLRMNELVIKLIANIIVVIINYILSKFIIFKKNSNK